MADARSRAGLDLPLIGVAALVGLAAGLGGIALTLLLHLVQHLAFGYTESTFLRGVEHATPLRRVLALAVGGLIVGVLWWAVRRWTRPLAGVQEAMADNRIRLPLLPAAAEGSLQIIAVGFGASLGREGAPRLLGACLAGWLSDRFGMDPSARRTMLACGAGAGLASVYNVPLGGALFTLEVLLMSAAAGDVAAALVSSTVAATVSWPVLSDQPTYLVAAVRFEPTVLVFGLLLGPVAGAVGSGFMRLTEWARTLVPTGWRLPVTITVVFTALGAAAIAFPQLLGNGKGPTQLAFDGTLGLLALTALIILKPLATSACLASGANGGLLTPAVAVGALLGALAGGGWSMWWPGSSIAAFALIGAAAVLATTQRAPISAIVLILEFTHTGLALLMPIAVAVAGAIFTGGLLDRTGRPARSP